MPAIHKILLIALLMAAPAAHAGGDTLQRVESYLNSLTTVRADFEQTSPDGTKATGTFYLKRPGKMRWEYDPPVPILMVSKDDTLVYYDKELAQTTYVPMKDTLAAFLARDRIVLSGEMTVDEITESDDRVLLTVHRTGNPEQGALTLEFSVSPLHLRSLFVTDAILQQTKISFSDARFGERIPEKLFVFEGDEIRRTK